MTMSADDAYYRSKTPLILSGTLDAQAKLHPSYTHVGDAMVTSSDKYYASASPVQTAPELVLELKRVQLIADADLVSGVISAFGAGAGLVIATGNALEVTQARLAVDLAVGRNVLTRAQADGVVFVTSVAVADMDVPAVEELVVQELPVTPVVIAAEELPATPVASVVEELQESGKKGRKRGKRAEVAESVDSKDITEADVSAVFGEDDSDS